MEKFDKSAKRKVLSFLESAAALLVWNGAFPAFLQYILISVSNIQIIALLFQSRLKIVESNEGISKLLSGALNLTTWQTIWTESDEQDTAFIIRSLVFIWLYLLVTLLAIFWAVRINMTLKKSLTKTQNVLTIFSQIHLVFAFSIINASLTDILNKMTSSSVSLSWLLSTIAGVLLIVNLLFGLGLALYSYDPFGTTNLLSCHTPSFQVLTFIIKAVLTLITISDDKSVSAYWIATLVSGIIMALRHYDLLMNLPFYDYKGTKVALILSSICLGTSLFNIIVPLIKADEDSFSSDHLVYAEIIIILLSIKFWHGVLKIIMVKALEQSNQSFTSTKNVIRKLFSIKHFLQDTKLSMNEIKLSSSEELYFWSLHSLPVQDIQSEVRTQNNITILSQIKTANLENPTKIDIKNIRVDCHQYARDYIRNFLKETLEKLQESNKFRTLLLLDCLDDADYAISSTFYLIGLLKAKDFRTRVIAQKLQDKLKRNLSSFYQEKKKNQLDIHTFTDYENISTNLVKMIYFNTQKHISFWKTYTSNNIKMKKLSEISKEFEIDHDQIHAYWTRKIESNTIFAGVLADIYSVYLSLIRNRPASAATIMRRATFLIENEKKLSLSPQRLDNHGTILINISMSKENNGNILYASSHVEEVLGWSARELIGRSLSLLIPMFARERHNHILKKHFRQIKDMTSPTLLEHPQETFILNEKGFIIPCKMSLSLCPDMKDGLVYTVIIQVDECKTKDYILLRQDNSIQGLTQNIGSELQLSGNSKTLIKDICQNYSQLKQAIYKLDLQAANDYDYTERRTEFLTDIISNDNTQYVGNLELCFKKQQSENMINYDTQLLTQNFCQIPIYILCLTKEINEGDGKSPLLPKIKVGNQSPESEASSNRVLEEEDDDLPEFAKALPSLDPLPPRPSSSRRLLEPITYTTEVSQRNKLITSIQSDMGLKPLSKIPKKQNDKPKQNPVFEDPDAFNASEGSMFSRKDDEMKIERALHSVPTDPRLKRLKLIGIILLLISMGALSIWEVQNTVTLGHVSGNIEVLSQSKAMLIQVLRLNRLTRFIELDDLGLLNPQRYLPYAVVTSIKGVVGPSIRDYGKDINKFNNKVKVALNRIDPALQKSIYQTKYSIYSQETVNTTMAHSANIFDFVTEIVSDAIKLGNTPLPNFNSQNPNVHFILDNTLNNLLVGGEQIVPILLEDSNQKLKNQEHLIIIIFSIMALICGLIIKIIHDIIRSFVQTRNRFWDIFSFLDNASIQEHLSKVNKFALCLEKSNFNSRSHHLDKEKLQFKSNKTKSSSRISKRTLEKTGINGFLFSHCFGFGLFISIVTMIYLVLFLMSSSQTNTIMGKLDLMTTSDNYLYELMVLYTTQYAYIHQNTTILRGQPISKQWHQTFNSFTQAQDFYLTTLLNKDHGIGMDDRPISLVKGDLCQLIDTTYKSLCRSIKGGPMQTGIVGMNSFFIAGFQSTIGSFEASNRTHDELYTILNAQDLAVEDVVSFYFADKAYNLVTDLLKSRLDEDICSFEDRFIITIICYCLFSLIVLIYAWLKVCKSFQEEMACWERIIRQTPWDVVVNNKFLKKVLSTR